MASETCGNLGLPGHKIGGLVTTTLVTKSYLATNVSQWPSCNLDLIMLIFSDRD